MQTIIQDFRRKLDTDHCDDEDLHKNIEKLCEKENWKYKYKYNTHNCCCDFVIIHNNNVYIVQARRNITREIKKDTKIVNIHNCTLFYKLMKSKHTSYWKNKQICGIIISNKGIELNCYNIGKHIVPCEGVINKDVFTTDGGVVYWS